MNELGVYEEYINEDENKQKMQNKFFIFNFKKIEFENLLII